ncbi:hypothetical protein D3C72_2165600 [compost metagenome]
MQFDIDLLEQGRESHAQRAIDDNAHGSALAVFTHESKRPRKNRVGQIGHRNQKLAREIHFHALIIAQEAVNTIFTCRRCTMAQ